MQKQKNMWKKFSTPDTDWDSIHSSQQTFATALGRVSLPYSAQERRKNSPIHGQCAIAVINTETRQNKVVRKRLQLLGGKVQKPYIGRNRCPKPVKSSRISQQSVSLLEGNNVLLDEGQMLTVQHPWFGKAGSMEAVLWKNTSKKLCSCICILPYCGNYLPP